MAELHLMKHLTLCALSWGAVCAAPTFAEAQTGPRWIKLPDAAALARYYPKAALASRLEGSANLDCQVGPGDSRTGDLTNCSVSDETPPGQGFGAAALNLAPLFRMQHLKDRSDVGARVRIPIHFRAP